MTGAKIGAIVTSALVIMYVALLGNTAIILIASGSLLPAMLGGLLMMFPILAIWAIVAELRFGLKVEKLAKQISYKLKELKRDKETIFLANAVAVPGAAVGATTRKAAGLEAWLITNASRGSGGAAPTLSGTTDGYPNAAHTPGTSRTITEDMLNTVIQSCWTQGGEVKYGIVGPGVKRTISKTFNGYATKYKDADAKRLVSAVDFYESEFGLIEIIPNRFSNAASMILIDPEFVKIVDLQPTRQLELARTGHTENRLIQYEGTLEVGNQKSCGIITSVT